VGAGSFNSGLMGEAVVLPAWDSSKTASAGSKSGFGRRKFGELGPLKAMPFPKPALAEPGR
jgi:hypothetical protein